MKFSKSELDIIYQYAAPTKAETLAGMKEIVPVIKRTADKGNRGERYPKIGKDTGTGVLPVCRRHESTVPCRA